MAEVKKDVQEKINRLSTMEQSLQSFLAQKQAFQSQLIEVKSALDELKKTDKAYKIIGNVMVSTDTPKLIEELQAKQEMLDIRIKTLEKQETKTREKTTELQSEVMKEIGD